LKKLKPILQGDATRRVLCRLAAWYIRLVRVTGRWRMVRGEAAEALWQSDEPFIGCFWHGRLLMMPTAWRQHGQIAVLASRHRDGELVAETVRHLGIAAIRGSSGKGGASALRAMVKALGGGTSVVITPDGPRGPRMRVNDGIVSVAQLSGRTILPASYGARRRIVLDTWDRFVVPLPFTGGVFVWGTPIAVPRDADAEACERARREIEEQLNALTAEADRLVGQRPVAPEPAAGDAKALQDEA
jgi:lysophospholipid acyltransferase (LPLAT)-like uncharacterized protein